MVIFSVTRFLSSFSKMCKSMVCHSNSHYIFGFSEDLVFPRGRVIGYWSLCSIIENLSKVAVKIMWKLLKGWMRTFWEILEYGKYWLIYASTSGFTHQRTSLSWLEHCCAEFFIILRRIFKFLGRLSKISELNLSSLLSQVTATISAYFVILDVDLKFF